MIHQEFDQVESTTKNIPWNQPRNIGKEGCLLPIEGNRKKLTKKAGKSPPAQVFYQMKTYLLSFLVSAGFSASAFLVEYGYFDHTSLYIVARDKALKHVRALVPDTTGKAGD